MNRFDRREAETPTELMATSTPKRGRRPTPIPKDAVERIKALRRRGIGAIVIAEIFGVSFTTFRKWQDEREDIRDAMATGKALNEHAYTNRLFELAMGNGPQALTAVIFALKCQHHWNDRPDGEAGSDRPVVQVIIKAPMTPESYTPPLMHEPAIIEHK
jgi:hypothetical protein